MSRPNITKSINHFLKKIGWNIQITILPDTAPFSVDMEEDFKKIYFQCQPYSMQSIEQMYAVYKAVEYVVKNKIPGDFVECGVWRGGCSMVAALTLIKFNDTSRNIYLYDTYAGMSEPTEKDVKYNGTSALEKWKKLDHHSHNEWSFASIEEVKDNLVQTKYPFEKMFFVKGRVEDTIPGTIPASIAVLRLDTDFYASTKHEFTHLYPKVSIKGVVLIDDYGHWKGSREATDEYIREHNLAILLNRVDYSGRSAIKCS